jgi:hypothetical protein
MGFTTPIALDLLDMAGIALAAERIEYRAGEHAAAIARAPVDARLVFSHAYPADAPENARSWIDPPLLPFLNNKASLPQLVPQANYPKRQVMAWSDFLDSPAQVPVVLKVATDQSTGAGTALVIYRSPADLPAARKKFAGVDTVVVEEMLDIAANPCLNFAVDRAAEVHFIGAAEQIIGDAGQFIGNWIDLDARCPGDLLDPARAVVERAAALGYRGFAGIDMVRLADGRTLVLDLNFRINSSTPALVIAPALRQRGVRVTRVATVRHAAGMEDLAHRLRPFVAGGEVVPLRLFDPVAAGLGGGEAIAHLIVAGQSREGVAETWARLGRSFALPEP